MRIAFVTLEFPTEPQFERGGGLAAYLANISRALVHSGHDVEVFIASELSPEVIDWNGARVQRVSRQPGAWERWFEQRILSWRPFRKLGAPALWNGVRTAWALRQAVHRRHQERRLEIVQASDYGFPGLFLSRRRGYVLLVRCSWSAQDFRQLDGEPNFAERTASQIEYQSIKRAHRIYAPSRLVAELIQRRTGRNVSVVRPPLPEEPRPAADQGTTRTSPPDLPSRYFIHFGQLGRRKGTDLVLEAAVLAAAEAPDLRVIVAGNFKQTQLREHAAFREGVAVLAGALNRIQLSEVVRGAVASVLPSRIDNLPNTAIESLAQGVPVIGTRSSSIDEIVTPGVNGVLVDAASPQELAAAMVSVWKGSQQFEMSRSSPVLAEMSPERAVASLLNLAAI